MLRVLPSREAMRNWEFRRKILLFPKIAAYALVIILALVLASGVVTERQLTRIEQGYYPSVQLSRTLERLLEEAQRGLQDAAAAHDVDRLAEADSAHREFLQRLRAGRDNPVVELQRLEVIGRDFDRYFTGARATTARLIGGGTDSGAGEGNESLLASFEQMKSRYNGVHASLAAASRIDELKIDAAFRTTRFLGRLVWILVVLVGLGCLWVLWRLTTTASDSVTEPLTGALRVADQLARGDVGAMATHIGPTSADEVGRLLRSMQLMVAYLREMAQLADAIARGDLSLRSEPRSAQDMFGKAFVAMQSYLVDMASVAERISSGNLDVQVAPRSHEDTFGNAFVSMTTRLSQVIAEVRSSAETMSAGADQVAAAAGELSRTTADEAAHVQETLAGLDEVGALVGRNAELSREMEAMALEGARNSEESAQSIRETIEAMHAITSKISVVDSIATQTNLLALNAAIEAARAGEHGKGFAVVADEVRRLSVQSREAARDIDELARSSRTVAERSGEIVTALTESMRKTTELVQAVASASAEQTAGLASVGDAMRLVDDVTQRNASAAEELAATAEEMAAQVETLQALLAFFRLGPDADRGVAGPPRGALPPLSPLVGVPT